MTGRVIMSMPHMDPTRPRKFNIRHKQTNISTRSQSDSLKASKAPIATATKNGPTTLARYSSGGHPVKSKYISGITSIENPKKIPIKKLIKNVYLVVDFISILNTNSSPLFKKMHGRNLIQCLNQYRIELL